eukprot:1075524-Amphidinium_carterae.1
MMMMMMMMMLLLSEPIGMTLHEDGTYHAMQIRFVLPVIYGQRARQGQCLSLPAPSQVGQSSLESMLVIDPSLAVGSSLSGTEASELCGQQRLAVHVAQTSAPRKCC